LLLERTVATQCIETNLLNYKRQTQSIVQSDYDVLARDQRNNNARIVSYIQQARGPNRLKARHHC